MTDQGIARGKPGPYKLKVQNVIEEQDCSVPVAARTNIEGLVAKMKSM